MIIPCWSISTELLPSSIQAINIATIRAHFFRYAGIKSSPSFSHPFNSEPMSNLFSLPFDPERDLSPSGSSGALSLAKCCHPFMKSCPTSGCMLGKICAIGCLYVGLVHASSSSSGPMRADAPIMRSSSLGTGMLYSVRERRNIFCKGPAIG